MKNMVVSGGTDGMGRALARHYVNSGWSVLIIGRNPDKGAEFLAEAERSGAAGRAVFLRADLSLVSEQYRAVAEIAEIFPVVDALVLGAQHFRRDRTVTEEGFESTFALYYLSRYVLSDELLPRLESADNPVVLNICGPGVPVGGIHWDDLQLEHGYTGLKAMMQGSRANDLLGVGMAKAHRSCKVRYVLYNPVFVATSFSGEYRKPVRLLVDLAKRIGATSVAKGIEPIIELLDDPPAKAISAYKKRQEISLGHQSFSETDATRLREITETILASRLTA
ncbi:SDR family NAD(P)-dependent oxidoreductase [Streptomyces sp. NPDC014894]|uniref:SDR family NAD(P)-dependent oxidoreductase n=1 Tax=Streptomyces sp. NPDC014894 TaxID=3364931 RepID=UPI0036FAA82D